MLSYLPASLNNPFKKEVRYGFKTYENCSVLTFQRILTCYTWSPIIWTGGVRHQSNFLESRYCGLDFEDIDVTIEDIKRRFCDSWYIIGTSRNHQKQKGDDPPMDRFRLLLKYERPITNLEEYRYNMKWMIDALGADRACLDGARYFFPCKEIVSVNCTEEGLYDEPVRSLPEDYAERLEEVRQRYIEEARLKNSRGSMTTFCRTWLLNPIPQGKRSVICWKLGRELCRAGIEYEDAIKRILASPTYAGTVVAPHVLKKIREQVLAGYKQVYKEIGTYKEKAP